MECSNLQEQSVQIVNRIQPQKRKPPVRVNKTIVTRIAVVILAASPCIANADELVLDISERSVHRRAVEAVIWSMPLMNFKAMRDAQKDLGAGFNDISYYSKIQTWQFQIATPNDTTPYIMSFWNLEDGPVVFELPPSTDDVGIFGTLMDSWHRPLEDVGAKGYDKGEGGKYLFLPPGYEGNVPAGYIPLQQQTYQGYTIMRPIIADSSDANLEKAVAFAKTIKVYSLADAGKPSKTRYVDIYGRLFDGIIKFDADFFAGLNDIVQEEHFAEHDLSMMGLLKTIGIEKGGEYSVDGRRNLILESAATEAHEYLINRYHTELLPPYYDGKEWTSIVPDGTVQTGFSFIFPDYLDYDARGALYYAVCTSAKNLGAATFYVTTAKDDTGEWLDGGGNYKFTVPANVPAKDFWSVVAYDVQSAGWILEQSKVGVDSNARDLQVNQDGSVDIYFGPETPDGKSSNWIPTVADGQFFLLFRFYGPEPAVFDKTWQLNDLVKFK
jgi:hypothetical protein